MTKSAEIRVSFFKRGAVIWLKRQLFTCSSQYAWGSLSISDPWRAAWPVLLKGSCLNPNTEDAAKGSTRFSSGLNSQPHIQYTSRWGTTQIFQSMFFTRSTLSSALDLSMPAVFWSIAEWSEEFGTTDSAQPYVLPWAAKTCIFKLSLVLFLICSHLSFKNIISKISKWKLLGTRKLYFSTKEMLNRVLQHLQIFKSEKTWKLLFSNGRCQLSRKQALGKNPPEF